MSSQLVLSSTSKSCPRQQCDLNRVFLPVLYDSWSNHRYLKKSPRESRSKIRQWKYRRDFTQCQQDSLPIDEQCQLHESCPSGNTSKSPRTCKSWPLDTRAHRRHARVRSTRTVVEEANFARTKFHFPLRSLQSSSLGRTKHLLSHLEVSGVGSVFVRQFFSNYTLPCSEVAADDGFLDYLPTLYHQSPQGSCLNATVYAVACAHVTELHECEWMQDAVALLYENAISLVEEALSDEREAAKDSTLVSLFLLSVLENIRCAKSSQLAWHHHIDQAVEIVCKRSEKQFFSLIGVKLFRTIYAHMLVGALCNRQSPVLPVAVWQNHYGLSRQSQLIHLMHRTAVICSSWHERSTSFPTQLLLSDISDFMTQSWELAADLQNWRKFAASEDLRGGNGAFIVPGPEPETSSSPDPNPHGFVSIAYLNIFRACSILLHQVIFQCLDEILSSHHLSGDKDIVAWLFKLALASETNTTQDSAKQAVQHILMQSTRVILEMSRGIQASVAQLLLNSHSSRSSTSAPILNTNPWTINGHFDAQDPPSLQKYALLFPVWAALSSQQVLVEPQTRDLVTKILPGGEDLRQRIEWLKDVMKYIQSEFRGISCDIDPEGVVDTPHQASDYARIHDWLNDSTDGDYFAYVPYQ